MTYSPRRGTARVEDVLARLGWPLGQRGRTACPLPTHSPRGNPSSFRYDDRGFQCFACNTHGTARDLDRLLLSDALAGLEDAGPLPTPARPLGWHPPWSRLLGALAWEAGDRTWQAAMKRLWVARRFRDFLGLVLYPRMQEEDDVDALLELVERTFVWEQRALMTLAYAERILARFRRERPR